MRYDQDKRSNILTFHLDRYDASGNRLPPVGVAMLNPQRGHLTEGDEVDVFGWTKYGTLAAKRIVNITTSSEMLGDLTSIVARRAAIGLLILLLFVGAIVFAAAVASSR